MIYIVVSQPVQYHANPPTNLAANRCTILITKYVMCCMLDRTAHGTRKIPVGISHCPSAVEGVTYGGMHRWQIDAVSLQHSLPNKRLFERISVEELLAIAVDDLSTAV